MAASRGKAKGKSNPFYVLLLVASAAFTITALAYLMGPFVAQRALDRPGSGPMALNLWLDRRGPSALAVEFVVMLVAALLAMATDRRYASPPAPPKPGNKRGHEEI